MGAESFLRHYAICGIIYRWVDAPSKFYIRTGKHSPPPQPFLPQLMLGLARTTSKLQLLSFYHYMHESNK